MAEKPRQLVVLCDGTNNNITGGRADTNVLKLMGLLEPDDDQLVFYDPGVGNASALPGATLMDRVRRRLDRLWGLAFGRGAYENIAEAYLFLMRNYRPGDKVFIFGFSRGAFTARAVAGLVNQFGILRRQHSNLVDTLVHVYFSDAKKGSDEKKQIDNVSADIRRLCTVPDSLVTHKVWFVGVWDTVESIGLPPFTREIHKPATVTGKRMVHVRQALALDEHRRPFRARLYAEDNFAELNEHDQTFKQEWFSGAHCDIGGGYEAGHGRLSDEALLWLVKEASDKELRVRTPQLSTSAPVIHCETQANPWWAAAGLCVREKTRVRVDGQWVAVKPVINDAGSKPPQLSFPTTTAWLDQRVRPALTALVFCVAAYLAMGAVLAGSWPFSVDFATWLGQVKQANDAMVKWQELPFGAPPPGQWKLTAMLLDFVFLGAYSYFLGWLMAPAFATLAGLGTATQRSNYVLNLFGMSLWLLVVSDVSENLLTIAIILADGYWYPFVGWIARAALFLAAALKYIGFVATLLVAAGGLLARVWIGYVSWQRSRMLAAAS